MDENPKPSRRERARQRHRQEILDAARKVLAAYGPDGTTVEQIAREAEFAVGSIYRYFGSKEELLGVLAGEMADCLLEDLAALDEEELPFAERIEQFVRTAFDQWTQNKPVILVLMRLPGDFPTMDSEFGRRMIAFRDRYHAAIDALLARGQSDGVIAPGDRLPMVLTLVALIESFAKWTMFASAGPPVDPPTLICRAFLDGFRRR